MIDRFGAGGERVRPSVRGVFRLACLCSFVCARVRFGAQASIRICACMCVCVNVCAVILARVLVHACVCARAHAESAEPSKSRIRSPDAAARIRRRPVRHARACARAVRFGAREPRAPRTRHAAAPRCVRISGPIPDTAAARPPDRGARALVQARAHQRRACVPTRVRADTAVCVCVCLCVPVCVLVPVCV